jgi:hypothetical protein
MKICCDAVNDCWGCRGSRGQSQRSNDSRNLCTRLGLELARARTRPARRGSKTIRVVASSPSQDSLGRVFAYSRFDSGSFERISGLKDSLCITDAIETGGPLS